MDERDERKRTSGDASKHYCSRKSVAETYLLATRCPVYRRRDSRSGSLTELENLSGDAKGKGASSETARPKGPMRRGGGGRRRITREAGECPRAEGVRRPAL